MIKRACAQVLLRGDALPGDDLGAEDVDLLLELGDPDDCLGGAALDKPPRLAFADHEHDHDRS